MNSEELFSRIVHGLRVTSSIPIEGFKLEAEPESPDLRIVLVEDLPDTEPGLVLSYDFDDDKLVRAYRAGDGSTLISFAGNGRFRVSPDLDLIEVLVPNTEVRGLTEILLQGWVMAMTLIMRGELVLHATAVRTGAGCLALLGDSGMGKSTVAAMLIRDGGELIAEDVLRVEAKTDHGWFAHPGTTTVRLRKAAEGLAKLMPDATLETTADDRIGARFDCKAPDPAELRAVLIPVPSRETSVLEIDWLDQSSAVAELNRYPRVFDWEDSGPTLRLFQQTAPLARDIPVGALTVPWGPPWPSNVLDEILERLPVT